MAETFQMQHFLLVFDHDAGTLLELLSFGDKSSDAVREYSLKEFEYRDRPSIDIVLVGSDSLDTVKLTHANYFDGSAAKSRFLAGI